MVFDRNCNLLEQVGPVVVHMYQHSCTSNE